MAFNRKHPLISYSTITMNFVPAGFSADSSLYLQSSAPCRYVDTRCKLRKERTFQTRRRAEDMGQKMGNKDRIDEDKMCFIEQNRKN